MILATHPAAALSWHQGLEAIVGADQKQRDSVWAMVAIAFASLADPRVLDAVSPGLGEQFDPEAFLRLWLNAGVPATQAAEWAGHSVAVLLRVYAKCIAGQEDSAQQRVEIALNSFTNKSTAADR